MRIPTVAFAQEPDRHTPHNHFDSLVMLAEITPATPSLVPVAQRPSMTSQRRQKSKKPGGQQGRVA